MRRLIAALLLGCATALASAGQPWAEEIPAAALDADTVRFVQANAEFTLLHEMGHLLIHELGLPVLGREEDAADQLGFMGLFLLYRRQHEPERASRARGCGRASSATCAGCPSTSLPPTTATPW